MRVPNGAFNIMRKNLFCITWKRSKCIFAAIQTGAAYNKAWYTFYKETIYILGAMYFSY